MQKMTKKLNNCILWLLLTVFLFNLGFSSLLIELSIRINRKEIEKIISEKNDIQFLVIKFDSPSSIIRKNKSEIIFEDKVYDVKSELKKDGSIYLYCFHDEKEGKLTSVYNETIKRNTDDQGNSQKQNPTFLIKIFSKDFYHERSPFIVNNYLEVNQKFAFADSFHSNEYFKVLIPPPKQIYS